MKKETLFIEASQFKSALVVETSRANAISKSRKPDTRAQGLFQRITSSTSLMVQASMASEVDVAKTIDKALTHQKTIPENINNYLTALYPNLKRNLLAKGINSLEVQDVLADFTIYLLSEDKEGTPRYLKFDHGKYNVLYHQWVIRTLDFFIRGHFTKKSTIMKREIALENPEDAKEGEFSESHQAFIDHSILSSISPAAILENKDLLMKALELAKEKVHSAFAKESMPSLVGGLIAGETQTEMAKKLEVSTCTVNKWNRLFIKSCHEASA